MQREIKLISTIYYLGELDIFIQLKGNLHFRKVFKLRIKVWFFGDRIKLIQSLQQSSLVDPQEDRMTNSFSDVKERDLQTPMSAGYLHKKTFFPPLAHKSRLMLRRSESERKLPAPVKYERGGGEPQLTGNIPVWYRSPTKPELHGYYIAKLNQLYYILVSSSRHL